MTNIPEEDSGGLRLIEALDALKASWNTGESSIGSIGSQLRGTSRVQTLLQLILIDSELAIQSQKNCTADGYINLFPELELHRASIETHISNLPTDIEAKNDNYSLGFFSKASIDHIIDPKSTIPLRDILDRSKDQSSQAPETPPKTIGSYRILMELGRGSFGQVLLAEDPRLSRNVAIKIQDKGNAEFGLSDAFLHEARAIARLEHPNIVRLLHVDETADGLGYLVYEYVAGNTLADQVKLANYTVDQAVQWIVEISGALDFAHRRGVIHRDISPRNIMIDASGTARLLDFGLSRLDEMFHTPDEDRLLGTPNFMSPEQASGKPHWATSYADLFSLGSVLYHAISGKLPFQGSSIFDVCERVQSATPPPLRSLRHDISPELEAVVNKAMAKEPQSRYSTGADFAKSLQLAVAASKPRVFQRQPTAPTPWLARIIALTMVLVGVGLLSWAWISYENSLPKAELFDIGILVERLGMPKSELLSNKGIDLLPLRNEDTIQLTWELKPGATSNTTPSILLFGDDENQRRVVYPSQLETYQLLATRSSPNDRLFPGKTLVLLCFSKNRLTEGQTKKLPSPWTSVANPLAKELICIVGAAPKIQKQLKTLELVKLRSAEGTTVKELEINRAFKNKLTDEYGVQTYFGFIIDRRATEQ